MARYSLDRGALNVSINASNANAAGDEFAILHSSFGELPAIITWQVIVSGGVYTSITVNLEGSLDGVNWFTYDTTTSATGELRHMPNKKARFFRITKTASVTSSGTPVVTASMVQ